MKVVYRNGVHYLRWKMDPQAETILEHKLESETMDTAKREAGRFLGENDLPTAIESERTTYMREWWKKNKQRIKERDATK